MVLWAGDKHKAATSLRLLYFTERFHFRCQIPRFSLHPLCPLRLPTDQTLSRGVDRQHVQGEDLATQRRAVVPERMLLGIWGRSGGMMWTHGKSPPARRLRCLQWHGSVQATESVSSFPEVKMALSESSLILLHMENRLLALHNRNSCILY